MTAPQHSSSGTDDARREVAHWMIRQGYITGHGDTMADLLGELVHQVHANALLEAHNVAQGSIDCGALDPPAKWLDERLHGLATELLADPKTPWIGERDPKQHICWTAADRLASIVEQCAKIAEPWPGYWLDSSSTDADRAVVAVRTEIAAKIRAMAVSSTDGATP